MSTNIDSSYEYTTNRKDGDRDRTQDEPDKSIPEKKNQLTYPENNEIHEDIKLVEQDSGATSSITGSTNEEIRNDINTNGENSFGNDNNSFVQSTRTRLEKSNETNRKPVAQIGRITNVYTSDYKTVTNEEDANVQRTIQELYNGSNENGMKWVEIEEASLFWDSLKINFKNAFQINTESNIDERNKQQIIIEKDSELCKEEQTVHEKEEYRQEETVKNVNKKNNKDFFLPVDVFVRCLNFLPADKILECEILDKLTSEVINTRPTVFKYVKILNLNEKWAKLPIFKRQYFLHQMEYIRHIKVSEKVFLGDGIYIHEVAAVIFQNAANLKSIELLSPELHSSDNTPRHEPFAFSTVCFEKLEKLTLIGCQTLEWLHILRNALFPALKKFEVCYYPLASDNGHWDNNFDFTILGVQGLYKILYTMQSLQRVTIGFDVLFDNADAEIDNPAGSRRSLLEPYSVVRSDNGNGINNNDTVPPANGFPSRRFRSYRGRLCEEDYSDIFSITYFIAGKYGKLKKIMIKYRNMYEFTEEENENVNTLNEFVTGAANTASVCYNYVINWFRSPNEI